MIQTYQQAIKRIEETGNAFEKSQIPELKQKIAILIQQVKRKPRKERIVIQQVEETTPETVFINHLSKYIDKEDITQAMMDKEQDIGEYLYRNNKD